MPESRQNNVSSINQLERKIHVVTWEEPEQWAGNKRFIFVLPLPAIYNINRD